MRFSISKKTKSESQWRGNTPQFQVRLERTHSRGTPRRYLQAGHLFLYDAALPRPSRRFFAQEGGEMSIDHARGGFTFQFYFSPRTKQNIWNDQLHVFFFFLPNQKKLLTPIFCCWPKSCSPSFNSLFCSYTFLQFMNYDLLAALLIRWQKM